MSWKRWEHASCFENLAKTPSTEKRKWIMFSIKLFWGSIFRDEGVSHPESKVWGKHRNNSYTFFELMNSGLCLILWIFVDSFCSGRAKSRCGGVLAVNFDDFYHQHSFRFHAFRTILLWFLLTLTSFISFGDYLNPGAAYTKMSQIGVIPRPAGLPLQHFIVQLCGGWLEPKIKSHQVVLANFTGQGREAWTKWSWAQIQQQHEESEPNSTWEEIWALRATCQRNRSLRRARARPAGLGEAGRSLTITIGATQLPPTPREDPERPRKGGG